MIIEVNNTFDERRMYVLPLNSNSDRESCQDDTCSSKTNLSHPHNQAKAFSYLWPKDFHVSPFNSRKGSYTISASDPRVPLLEYSKSHSIENPIVDIKATLLSSKEHPKMIAHLLSISKPLDPATMSYLDMVAFMFSWWWVGLMTSK